MQKVRLSEEAGYRYGVVLLVAFVAVVFFIVSPERPASRAIGLVLTVTMLVVVVVTGRGGAIMRETTAAVAAVLALGVAVAVALDGVPTWVGSALGIILVGGTIAELVVGLGRMLRVRGVTVQAVAGALAVYLLLGLLCSLIVTVAARAGSGTFFAEGTDGSQSQHVYFSFTTMTTTGYGDLTPATSFGRAIAVVAMLVGQIYLVTIIGLLVGNLRRARTT
ncbi:potassium channel family protein [Conexibacter woesei]|uniref:potassium channel family protein n=1 Tax=Conexibacter woesei TaxID=191495 RepID=UPI0002D3D225|nr:potassium channel family protein [Conexibacter woesei]